MKKYELAVVLSASIDDNARIDEISKIKGYIERFGGKVIEPIEEWGKKRFAFPVKHANEGFYYFIPFEGNSVTPNELESYVRIMDNVLRYLVVAKES
ncbi:MAG: 30S ribosomal protein S6 [Eubacteriales bacterium]|nr:30S ribosomal protein S6 [Eubacteriales bacterium]